MTALLFRTASSRTLASTRCFVMECLAEFSLLLHRLCRDDPPHRRIAACLVELAAEDDLAALHDIDAARVIGHVL